MNQLLFKQLSVQLAAETSFDRKILNAIKSSKFRLSSDVQGQKAVDDAMDFEFEEEFWNSFFPFDRYGNKGVLFFYLKALSDDNTLGILKFYEKSLIEIVDSHKLIPRDFVEHMIRFIKKHNRKG